MCGLVGVAGNIFGKPKDMFTELLVIDSLRGMHSTGVAVVERHNSKFNVVKRPGPSQFLIADPQYKSAIGYSAKALIGHNRYATLGAHTTENAHPFEFEHVVGAHNGTLEKWSVKNLHDNTKFDTDSEAIFSHINAYGIAATVKQLHGAWALVWYDRRDNTLNFLRNEKRPLFYTYSQDRSVIMWASEVEMLEFTLARNNCKYEGQTFYQVDKDMHLKWELPAGHNDKFEAPFKEAMEETKTVSWSYGRHNSMAYAEAYGGACGWEADDEDWTKWNATDVETQSTKEVKVVTLGVDNTVGKQTVIQFPGKAQPVTQPKSRIDTSGFRPPYKVGAKVFGKEQFNKIVGNGCAFCSDNGSEWGEFIKILPESVNGVHMFVCEPCFNKDDVQDICNLCV